MSNYTPPSSAAPTQISHDWVTDSANPPVTHYVSRVYDPATGTETVVYKDKPNGVVTTPTMPVAPAGASADVSRRAKIVALTASGTLSDCLSYDFTNTGTVNATITTVTDGAFTLLPGASIADSVTYPATFDDIDYDPGVGGELTLVATLP